jgi:hypothetical protein
VGILRITIDDKTRISAVSARIHVTVHGQSSFASAASTRKAREVRELVAALAEHGISEDAIEVRGVRIENGQGRLGAKSQQAVFSLLISVSPEELPAALGVLAERGNTNRLEWVYDEFEDTIEATAEAMHKARRKAEVVAAAAGQQITGVVQVTDTWSRPVTTVNMGDAAYTPRGGAASAAPALDLGLDLTASAELSIHLSADFEIGQ